MDYSVIKAFLDLFYYPIECVSIRDIYLCFCVKVPSSDTSVLSTMNCIRISFPDRQDFVYYPEIRITYDSGLRVYQFFYHKDKVEEYVRLTNLEYH